MLPAAVRCAKILTTLAMYAMPVDTLPMAIRKWFKGEKAMKINRQQVLEKYDSHCAYCGQEITLKTMQMDHFIPRRLDGTDDYENLMPSCRRCNHYKRDNGIESFRKLMRTIHERIMKNYIVKVAIDYGIVIINQWDGLFYYEREKQ